MQSGGFGIVLPAASDGYSYAQHDHMLWLSPFWLMPLIALSGFVAFYIFFATKEERFGA